MTISPMESSQAEPISKIQQVKDFLSTKREDDRLNAIATWVKGEFDKCKQQRWNVERQWYLNLSFFQGHHYVQWIRSAASTTGYQLFIPPAPPWRVRLTVNKVRPVIRKEIAKLTSQKPNWTVVPNTTEDQDIVAAQVAEQIFASAYEEKELQIRLKRSVWWSSVCGTGYLKCYWDADAVCGYGDYKYNGDIMIEQIDPFHVYIPDLTEEDIEKQPYVIHAQTRPVEFVNSQFPGFNIQADAKSASEIMEEAYLKLTSQKTNFTDQVLMLEMWIKPNMHPKFPDGACILVAGGQVVYISEEDVTDPLSGLPTGMKQVKYPYDHNFYPFAKIDHVLSGRYYATSVIDDLIPVQREYNRTRSQIVENKNMTGRPQFIAPKGTMQADKITTEPGQIIPYLPGLGPPTQLQPTALPTYISEHMDRLEKDFDDLSAQHEISRGEAPGSVVAATAITSLQEADDSQLSTTIDSVEAAIKKTGKLYLCYVVQFWDTPRLVKTTGVDAAFDAQLYQGSAIQGNTDIRVESGSALATSKSAKRAFIMDLMTNQIIPPEEGLKMLEIGGVEKMFEELLIDEKQASRENLKMSMLMQPVPPNMWDNHDVHIMVHNRFRKTQQYEMLPPQIQMLFEQHVTTHQLAQQFAMMQSMMPPDAIEQQNNPYQELPPGTPEPVPAEQPPLPGM